MHRKESASAADSVKEEAEVEAFVLQRNFDLSVLKPCTRTLCHLIFIFLQLWTWHMCVYVVRNDYVHTDTLKTSLLAMECLFLV